MKDRCQVSELRKTAYQKNELKIVENPLIDLAYRRLPMTSCATGFAAPVLLGVRPKFRQTSTCHLVPSCIAPASYSEQLSAAKVTLLEACDGYIKGGSRPQAKKVSEALVATAKASRKSKGTVDSELIRSGKWRLILAAEQQGMLKDFYFPFHVEAVWGDRFVNTVLLGPGKFVIEGPARWVPEKSILEFTFSDVTVSLGPLKFERKGLDKEGSTLEGRTAKTLPFFSFFLADNEVAGARGRSGGLALWRRISE